MDAISIAVGSIHFTKTVSELSTSLVYWINSFSKTLFRVEVFSHAFNICIKSLLKNLCSGSISSILSDIFFQEETRLAISKTNHLYTSLFAASAVSFKDFIISIHDHKSNQRLDAIFDRI